MVLDTTGVPPWRLYTQTDGQEVGGGVKRERPDSFPVGGGGGAARCTPGEAAAGRPPFLARNSALVAEPAAAAAHTVRLLLLLPALLHTCVASCQAGSRLQSVRIILA